MPSWVIVLIIIAAVIAADVIYLIRKKRSGKCSCGHDCGSCCNCSAKKTKG